MRGYALRDDQWERVEMLLPGTAGDRGVRAADNWLFVEAVLYRYRAGIAWRDLAERFGDFRVIHTRHMRWSRKGVWGRVFKALAQDADNEYAMIDSTIVCAHQHSLRARGSSKNECIGRSRGGLSTKIHTLCDALGNLLRFHLTPGQACDLDGADVLIDTIKADTLLADRGYDADKRIINQLAAAEIEPVIPPKSNRKHQRDYDRALYRARHLVENFFAKLKHYRAIATRYDKTAS